MKALNKNWLIGLAVFVCLGIFFSTIIKIITPQEQVVVQSDFVSQNITETTSGFDNLTLSVSESQLSLLPKKLPVFTVTHSDKTSQIIKERLISQYGLKREDQDSIWLGSKYYMTFLPENSEYFLASQKTENLLAEISLSEAKAACESFMNPLISDQPIQLEMIEDEVEYFEGKFQFTPSTKINATWIRIPYSLSHQGYPFFLKNNNRFPISCLVSSAPAVHKFRFQDAFYELGSSRQQLSLISPASAILNLNEKGLGSIIYAEKQTSNPEHKGLNLSNIKSGDLKSVSIEYRIDPDQSTAYPFYKFTGEIVNSQGESLSAKIITPAVETKKID